MGNNNLKSTLDKTSEHVKGYMQEEIELLKLETTEKIVRFSTLLITSVLLILFGGLVLLFLIAALSVYIAQILDSYIYSFVLIAGCLTLLLAILYLARRILFREPILRKIIKILYS